MHPHPSTVSARVFICDLCGDWFDMPGLTPEAELAHDMPGLSAIWVDGDLPCFDCAGPA